MAICENCGKKYAPTATAPDCPNCAPAAEEVPIVPRKRQAAPAGAPAGAAPQARPAAPQQQRPAAQQRAAAPPARGAPSRAAPPPPPAHHGHHFQHPELLQKPGIEPIVKIGFGIAVGLLIVTAVVFFTVRGKLAATAAQIQAEVDAKREFMNDVHGKDFNVEAQAREIIKLADEKKELWSTDDNLRNEVQSIVGKCHVTLDQSQQRKDAEAKLAGIEAALKNSAGLNSDNVKDLQTQLSELARLELPVEAFNKRIKEATTTCGKLFATKLHDDSIAFANNNASQPRLGLNRYYQAEEELKKLLDDAYRAAMSGKTPEDKAKGEEDKKFYEPMYKEIVEAADRTAVQLFTAGDVIDSISYTDMLTAPQATNWNPKKYQAVNGGLEIDASDPALKGAPVVSIGDREQLRNYVIDMEFTLDKGSVQVLFHLGPKVTVNTHGFDLHAEGQSENVSSGKVMQARCALIGNQFTWRFLNDAVGGEIKQDVQWTMTRKGGIGFQVTPGSKFKVTKFKVKILQ